MTRDYSTRCSVKSLTRLYCDLVDCWCRACGTTRVDTTDDSEQANTRMMEDVGIGMRMAKIPVSIVRCRFFDSSWSVVEGNADEAVVYETVGGVRRRM